jgi:hypothetical protein
MKYKIGDLLIETWPDINNGKEIRNWIVIDITTRTVGNTSDLVYIALKDFSKEVMVHKYDGLLDRSIREGQLTYFPVKKDNK